MAQILTFDKPHVSRDVQRATDVPLAIGLFLLGVGAAAVALLGPLVFDVIQYHASEGAIDQVRGGDVAGLVLVAPLTFFAAALVLRRHEAGRVLALGPAVYALYMYSQLALGMDVAQYPGNSERFFALYVGLFVLGGAIALRSWTAIDPTRLPHTPRWLRRSVGSFFLLVAAFLTVGLHLPGLIDAWSAEPTSAEYLADPVVFWLVKFMDLALVVPALVVVGIGVLRGRRWASKAMMAAVGWTTLLGASVAGMAVVMRASGDPAATVVNVVAFVGFALFAAGLAVAAYRPLFAEAED